MRHPRDYTPQDNWNLAAINLGLLATLCFIVALVLHAKQPQFSSPGMVAVLVAVGAFFAAACWRVKRHIYHRFVEVPAGIVTGRFMRDGEYVLRIQGLTRAGELAMQDRLVKEKTWDEHQVNDHFPAP